MVISKPIGLWNLKISVLHVNASVISSSFLGWLAAILITPLSTIISISSPVLGLSRAAVSCEFRDIGLPLLLRRWYSCSLTCLIVFCYTRLCLIFLREFFCYLWTDTSRSRAYLMPLIARCGFLFLSLLVIFALFEVRYDTLRRRDKEAVSVYARPTVFLRA